MSRYFRVLIQVFSPILLFITISQGDAWGQSMRFKYLTVEDGLSQNTVAAIVQDSLGFMWFGTRNGLCRYDGYTFRVFESSPTDTLSLLSNTINSLEVESATKLWIGTSQGLCLWDQEKGKIFQMNTSFENDSLNGHYNIGDLFVDSSGDFWLMGGASGFHIFRKKRGERNFKKVLFLKDPPGNNEGFYGQFMEDIHQDVWVGTSRRGIWKFDREQQQFVTLPEVDNENLAVTSMVRDHNGVAWVGTLSGLYRWSNERKELELVRGMNDSLVRSLYVDNDGRVIVGTDKGGLNIYDENTRTFVQHNEGSGSRASLLHNSIQCVYQDKQDILWVGTYAGGVNYHNPRDDMFGIYQSGLGDNFLNSNIISGFTEDKYGNIWIATDRGGLNYLDRKKNKFKYLRNNNTNSQSLATDIIQHVNTSSQGNLLIATWLKGFDVYNPDTKLFSHYTHDPDDFTTIADNSVNFVIEDSKGFLWLGTNRGLSVSTSRQHSKRLAPKLQFKNFRNDPDKKNSISDSYVKTIFEDKNGAIWLSTWVGLNRWDPASETFFNFNNNPEKLTVFTKHYILCINEDDHGNLLLGTNENGLLIYNRESNELRSFTRANGLPSNTIVGLQQDRRGYWWVSTSNGLVRFNPQDGSCAVYNRYDGLPSNEFRSNAHGKLKTGELLFGGNNGFTIFHPDSITANLFAPKVSLTGFRLFNELIEPTANGILTNDISVTKEIVLPPQYSSIGIDFVGINFTAPQKNRYAYMLDGLDKDWNYTSDQHSANYSYLPAGSYRFQVKVANSDGAWSAPSSISITISPYWWNTLWFRGLAVLMLVTLAGLIFRIRTRQLLIRKKILEDTVEERTSELQRKNSLLSDAKEELQLQTEEIKQQRDNIEGQLRTIQTLNEIGHKITAYLKKDELVTSIHSMINRFMDAPHLAIGHISGNEIQFSAIRSKDAPIVDVSLSLDETNRLSVFCVTQNRVLVVGDILSEINMLLPQHSRKYENENGLKSSVYIPLVSMNGAVTGILIVKSFHKHAFSAMQVDILKTLAAYIGIAYENAHVYKEIEAQSQLLSQQANKLKELDEIKSRFFINMSHEFRTPLTLIISPLEQMLENEKAPDWPYLRQQLEIMNKNAVHLLKLINQLLEVKNIELKIGKPEFAPYDIVAFLKSLMVQFDQLADRYAIHFRMITSTFPVVVHIDREMIEKVFINLYSNAFKYTPKGGSITTTLAVETNADSSFARIEISDSGKGIAKKDLPFIFERFYQGDDPLHRIQEGTGLGLSIVKDLVELHSGKVEVSSEEGKGTTISVFLPCPAESFPKQTFAITDDEFEEEAENKLQPLLLLIDDNPDVLEFLKLSLQNDFRLLLADNGKVGIELATQHVPDIIVSDVMMPVMDGIAFCNNVKSDTRTSHIPVVLLTAKSGEHSQLIGLDAGADDYIAKPFKVKLLKARINNIISTRRKLHELFSSHRNFEIGEFIANDHDKDFLEKLDQILKLNIRNTAFNQELLTREIGMSKTQLYRKLKALTGKTVHEYIRNYRLRVAHEIIRQSDMLIYEVAYEVGFSDAAYFSNSFHAYFGIWPKDLKKV